MSQVLITESNLQNIADAIRTKNGLTTKYTPSTMANAILNIPGGGGSATIESLTVTPSTSAQTFNASGVDGYKPVTVNAMPSGTVTAPSTISGTSATITTGKNTLTLNKSVLVTPNVTTAGYVSSGTAGNSSVSLTANMSTQGATTYTPGTTDQTIASGIYLTGTQTISGDADLVAGNIKKGVQIFGVTGTHGYNFPGENMTFIQTLFDRTYNLKNDTTYPSWTASTTAKSIMATKTAGTFTASNMSTTSYLLRWKCITTVAFNTGATLVKIPIQHIVIFDQYIYRRPSNWANVQSYTRNYNVYSNLTTLPFIKYYNANGEVASAWSASYGLYPAVGTPTFSSSTAASPTVTAKTPTWNARCSTTYFDTARYGDIDQDNTTIRFIAEVYSLDYNDQVMRSAFDTLIDYVHDVNNL